MLRRSIWNLWVCGLAGLLMASGSALACESKDNKMKTTEFGFIYKIVGGSDKVEAKKAPGSKDTVFTLDLLAPYYVICEEDQFYKVTDLQAETAKEAETGKVGYVLKDQVHPWPTREALNFSLVAFRGERSEIVAWDNEDTLSKFLETGNHKIAPPAFKEDLASTLKRERATRPYPVLSSDTKMMLKSREKRVYHVLLPAALPPEAKVVITPDKPTQAAEKADLEKVMRSATFCIVFDSTASMGPFAKDVAADIKATFDALPPDIAKSSTVGFVFYRDEFDEEKIVITNPMPVEAAMKALTEAAKYMSGGGDPPEPVLDAVYVGHHFFKWNEGQGGGRRIMLVVLSDDAKVPTTGKIHDGVPPGLEAAKIAEDLLADGIKTITVQAGPGDGGKLSSTLTTLAETTGGTFVEWGSGGDERRKKVTAAVANQLTTARKETDEEGKRTMAKLEFDYRGYPTIPLAVLDGEKLNRMRVSGVKFNIDPGKGGVLINEGYILENQDLLDPQISIDKKTLDGLIHLFQVLGAAGVDTQAMKESAASALSAIAGEGYDPKESIEVTIRKRLGINFRTKLLDFNLEFLAGMNQNERLAMTKRIQERATILSQFMEANLEQFNKAPAVWMPVSQLP
jgi:hypothetical protein